MDEEIKVPRPLEAFLVLIGSFILVVVLVEMFVLLFAPDLDMDSQNLTTVKYLITIGELGLGLFPLLYLKMRQYPVRTIFRWKPVPRDVVLLSILLGISLGILGDELDRLVNLIVPAPEFLQEISEILKIRSVTDFILMVSGAVFFAAVVEESIIRGMLQLSLEKFQNVTRAVIYSSLAWAFIHDVLYWALQIFLLGIILGYLAWRTDSIIPSAICHGINNTLALIFVNLDVEKTLPFYTWKGHVSPLLVIIAAIVLYKGIQYLDGRYRPVDDFDNPTDSGA